MESEFSTQKKLLILSGVLNDDDQVFLPGPVRNCPWSYLTGRTYHEVEVVTPSISISFLACAKCI